tara:strand:- start:404 stop:568 length:165 start_codon:yes stop_codon:yes gene_type:complete
MVHVATVSAHLAASVVSRLHIHTPEVKAKRVVGTAPFASDQARQHLFLPPFNGL